MKQTIAILSVSVLLLPLGASLLYSQGFGGAGGLGSGRESSNSGSEGRWSSGSSISILDPDASRQVITVDATVEMRLVPEEIRIVFSLTSEAVTADECQKEIEEQIQAIRDEWGNLKIPTDKIVEDFISVLPRYEWHLTQRDQHEVRMQQRVGFRMQTNLHVAVKSEREAMDAIDRAFKQGVTDVVTFDYWSSKINGQMEKARAKAVDAAKKKADTLLAVFDKRPKVINVQERTAVFFPRSLYRTYENILEEQEGNWDGWRDKPRIKAYRPKNTFYQGLQSDSDVRPEELAMRPEIAVVSTVRLYYQSPADQDLGGKKVDSGE